MGVNLKEVMPTGTTESGSNYGNSNYGGNCISSNYPRNIVQKSATQYDEGLAIKEGMFYVFHTIIRRTIGIQRIIKIMIKFVILEATYV